MSSPGVYYRGGYKYQLARTYVHDRPLLVFPGADIVEDFIELTMNGILTIKKGYAWDGPSGPTFDTKTFMRGSLVHDALYQLLRLGLLSNVLDTDGKARLIADLELKRICLEDGMWRVRAWWVFKGVHWFAARAASVKYPRAPTWAP